MKIINKKQKLDILSKFIKLCKKHNIWYCVTGETMLGAVRENDLIDSKKNPEVMMTIESYEKLKKKCPNNIIDSTINNLYPFISPKFQNNKELNNLYIDIFILVPTNAKKIKKFINMKSKIIYFLQMICGQYKAKNKREKFTQFIISPFKSKIKKKSYKSVYNELYEKNHKGFYEIHKPFCYPEKHWIPQITFKTITVNLNILKVNIPYEFDTILNIKYDSNYMNT